MVRFVISTILLASSPHHTRNFETILLDAYRWLSENYQPGDRIFLFGILLWALSWSVRL